MKKESITGTTLVILNTHSLSSPTVIYPTYGETLEGTVEIEWTEAIDSLGHNVFYSIFYISDGGVTWEILMEQNSKTKLEWDTTQVPDGPNYQIKIKAIYYEGLTKEAISNTFNIKIPTVKKSSGWILITIFVSTLTVVLIRKLKLKY